MEVLYIETFTRAMKKKGITQGKAELDDYPLTIDLDNLFIVIGRDSFELAKIPGTKGGYRYFFLCPYCGRRCRKLYKRYLYFGCGTCQQIHKQTLNRSKTDCQYYWGLAIREARKIEPSYWPEKGYVDYDQFPSRPKRMRSNTYWRHYNRFCKYITKGIKLWLK
ncbi:hypothetical protein [Streptococcus hillyeri]|uniref:Phage protein n=1 Tax=Streptococcus hillyeri TaxID=2282420 RepID=A0A3L9DQ17_9STRE|nr:hypothetical protein [Streptococcus hillyeri]RLY03401.1 hypothetical protein EAF07_05080 [Streptococcus hillyeri]